MSLRGSLDTFALPDVLALLASTSKCGELHVSGPSGEGRVWLDGGQIVAARAGSADDVVEVLVTLLRLDRGDFSFHNDERATDPGSPTDVALAMEQAAARLSEWHEVEAILPSADALLTLAPVAPGAVRLSKEQWAAVAAMGDGRPVRELVETLAGEELAAWRLLAGLVEAGLVEVGEAVEPLVAPVRRTELAQQLSTLSVAAITEDSEPEPVVSDGESDEVEEDEVEVDEIDEVDEVDEVDEAMAPSAPPVPAAAATAAGDPTDAVSRGTLLKFLSSVRS